MPNLARGTFIGVLPPPILTWPKEEGVSTLAGGTYLGVPLSWPGPGGRGTYLGWMIPTLGYPLPPSWPRWGGTYVGLGSRYLSPPFWPGQGTPCLDLARVPPPSGVNRLKILPSPILRMQSVITKPKHSRFTQFYQSTDIQMDKCSCISYSKTSILPFCQVCSLFLTFRFTNLRSKPYLRIFFLIVLIYDLWFVDLSSY